MLPALLPLLVPIITDLVGRIPDPAARDKAAADAQTKLLDLVSQQNQSQVEINKIEAASSSVFVAGWRPFIGWTCGAALAWQYVGLPIAAAIVVNIDPSIVLPSINGDYLMELVFAMLGFGGLRSFDKIKGTATK
jgi:hypothetical protein